MLGLAGSDGDSGSRSGAALSPQNSRNLIVALLDEDTIMTASLIDHVCHHHSQIDGIWLKSSPTLYPMVSI